MKSPPAALVLALGAACAAKLPDEPVLKEHAVSQTAFPLGSGLRVLVQENHNTPLVTVTAVFDAGSTSDPPGREGLAHLVEHLAFRARPGDGKRAIWDLLKRTGATFNASTSPDLTSYYATAHRDRFADLMQLEGSRLAGALDGVTEETFQIEREVVQNELRERHETTIGSRSFDELFVRLFPADHPLSRPVAGTHASLAAITLEDARSFAATHYRPERCTIVVAGDLKAQQVRELLGRWPANLLFGPEGPSGPKIQPRLVARTLPPPVPAPVSTTLGRLKGPVPEPILMIAWSLPGGLRGRDAMTLFAGDAIRDSLRARLRGELNDEILGFGAGADPLVDASIVFITARLRAGADPERVRTRLLDAVGGAWSIESNQEVRLRAWSVATDLLRASADPVTNAQEVAQFLATTGVTSYYTATLRQLASLTPGTMMAFAYKYLNRNRAVSVVFEPEDGGGIPARAASPGHRGGHHQAFADDVNLLGFGPEEIRAVAHPPGLARLPRVKLANGLEVVLIHRPGLPVAEIHLQIPGGDATAVPHGLASLATNMSTPCAPERSGVGLYWVGGSLSERHGPLSSRFTVGVMSGNLRNGLARLADTVACRHVDDTGFQWHSQRMKERADRQRERQASPQVRAEKALWSALYPRHAYGRVEPDVQSLGELSHSDLRAYVESHFRPNGSLAVVIADAGPDVVTRMVQEYYESWEGGTGRGPRPAPVPAESPRRTIHLFDRPGATQSTLALGCRIGPVVPEKLPAFDLLSGILREQAWEMREAWGATYGIHPRIDELPGAAHLLVRGSVETARTGAAIEKLLSLIADLGNKGPDIRTFTIRRWDLARAFDLDFATPADMAQAILRANLNGWPLDTWDHYPERLASTTRADVREAIASCRHHEVITVVGDASSVRPQVQQQDLDAWLAPP